MRHAYPPFQEFYRALAPVGPFFDESLPDLFNQPIGPAGGDVEISALDICGPTYQSFGRDYQAGSIETFYIISPDTPQHGVSLSAPQIDLQWHGPLHRRRHRHRGATHHDRRNERVVALTPIREVAAQQPPMSEKQAIVLILLLSLGLWATIWGLIVAIADVLDCLF
jgi:hypothetical protein